MNREKGGGGSKEEKSLGRNEEGKGWGRGKEKLLGEEGGIFWEKVVTLQKLMKMRRIE